MYRFFTGLFKIALASLLAGSLMSFIGITTDSILAFLGLTMDEFWSGLTSAGAWASPRILLGAIIVLPIWFLTYLLLPPRDG
ncbi:MULTISPECIES: DUF6460 domain-containing protein [Alphaproteobacteria]|uniref:DUF6460 domain-containing protein n=2 Tax=Alphaproteobacteria TaxID=28211 RepID=A0A512HID7_9HYPH|nr:MULTISPECIES: DUF6460 domain-containing protein [Alphaproteobacteria]GEO85202.1 hypothetical protein RNA01_21340 [Ciceribacter naphthalenivorans]GLR24464.1 hypothetical protein GCM10007920_42580 [Ciceribacter naphthalenivorans]GLT07320.1 hypothetical protein GCM10007926_42580 [Sphingomonas psychrolutea]